MHLRVPHTAIKKKNHHNSQNVQVIVIHFQDLLKFILKFIMVTYLK